MLAPVPHHLRPSTPYAPDALLPGDPGRALALAQQLLTEPKMSNHARGLWGYSGETPNGNPLS
jgi:purine-nucleoside phosphorylase